jgi:hypothetical protein
MPSFEVNQPIIWATNMDDPATIRRATIVKVSGEFIQYGPTMADSVHVAFVFPARVEADLIEVLTKRQQLKKAYDDSMKLIYELRNAITRGEK